MLEGSGDLLPSLSWPTRPDMAGSEASAALQRAWVATVMAFQELHGPLRVGGCLFLNLAAAPLVERVIGEPATACAGYARFVAAGQRIEFGLRWRPDKWAPFVDGVDRAIDELDVMADLHVWLETRAHVIDFSTCQLGPMMRAAPGAWPPLICWPKWRLPKHPREARGDRAVLLWRNAAALTFPMVVSAPIVGPATRRALEIFDDLS